MTFPARNVFGLTGLCLLLAGCAQTGAPLPPSLELPKPPNDLRAVRKGNTVNLTWTEPVLTTDRQTVRSQGPTLICRSAERDLTTCANPVATIPPSAPTSGTTPKPQPRAATPRNATDNLPANLLTDDPNSEVTYAVEAQNRNQRAAGVSNRVHVPSARTLPPPDDLAAKLTDDGVLLTWTSPGEPPVIQGLQHHYRVYRRDEAAGKEGIAGEVPISGLGPAQFLDAIEWERTYIYRVTAVTVVSRPGTELQIEGDDTVPLRIVAHDVLPPPVPTGLEAVYSGEGQKPFVDLIWAPAASADLAGYNIYRSESDGQPVKLNSDLVKVPSYRDLSVTPGTTYSYSVSSVDARGNESAQSETATETAPKNN
jgi:hypothetical protein